MYQYSRAAQMLLAYAASAAPSSRDACFPVATGFSNQTHRFASVVPSTVIPLISTAVEAPRHLVARVMEEERMRAAAQERMELAAIEKRDIGSQHVTFSFGKNWWNFLYRLKQSMVEKAQADITQWLGNVRKLRVIDVGSGSGLASLSFLRLGASEVVSIDVDKYSVAATMRLRANQSGSFSGEWKVYQGSVLDQNFIWSLGRFDVVHSWGSLAPHWRSAPRPRQPEPSGARGRQAAGDTLSGWEAVPGTLGHEAAVQPGKRGGKACHD